MNGALLEKAWLESRSRFLAAASVFVLLGILTVARATSTIAAHEISHAERLSYALYVWLSLWHGYLQVLWIIAAVILGLGGVLRETAYGTAAFTLSLPVSRSRIVYSRATVGALQAIVLAMLPPLVVWSISPLAGRAYSLSQLALFAVCFIGSGLVFFGLAFLIAHLLSGEYSAPGLTLGVIACFYVMTKLRRFASMDVFSLMAGKPFLLRPLAFDPGKASWAPIAGWFALFLVLVSASAYVTRRRDF